jgi:cleavage and polyadenylation specificity factor subunit 3
LALGEDLAWSQSLAWLLFVAFAEMHIIAALLSAQFGPAQADLEQGVVLVNVDSKHVVVDYKSGKVLCSDEQLLVRVEKSVQRLSAAMRPCATDYL